MSLRWLVLLVVAVVSGCATSTHPAVSGVPHRAVRPEISPPPKALPAPASLTPDEAYRRARDLLTQGQPEQARMLIQPRVEPPRSVKGAEAEGNARWLALLGQIAAEQRPPSQESLRRAEAYLAWAMASDPCMGEYWHEYMRVRLRRSGYSGLLAQLENREPVTYSAAEIGFSRSLLAVPWADSWLYLRGLLNAETNRFEEALKELEDFKKAHNTCPVDQTIGEVLLAMHHPQQAVRYLTPASEALPGRRSAARFYALGLARKALGDLAAARLALLESSRLDPTRDEPRRALLEIDWEQTGDPDLQDRLFRSTLSERPADWDSWVAFWQARFRSGVAPVEEYRRFAAEMSGAHSSLSQPLIAEALSRLSEDDFAGASKLAEEAGQRSDDALSALARLLFAACNQDGAAAERALNALASKDPGLYSLLLRHGVKPLVAALASPGGPQPERARVVGQFLLRLSTEPEAGSLVSAIKEAYFHGVQASPEGQRVAMDALVSETTVLGVTQVTVERRVALSEAQIKDLNAEAMGILARLKSMDETQVRHEKQIVLLDADLKRLAQEMKEIAAQLKASEHVLTEKLRKGDTKVHEALILLGSEIQNHQESLAKAQTTLAKNQESIRMQKGMLQSLARAQTSSAEEIATDTTIVADLVENAAGLLSLGPGGVSFRVIGTLAKLVKTLTK